MYVQESFVHTILEFLQVFSPISILNSLLNIEAEHLLCAECLELFIELWCKFVAYFHGYLLGKHTVSEP